MTSWISGTVSFLERMAWHKKKKSSQLTFQWDSHSLLFQLKGKGRFKNICELFTGSFNVHLDNTRFAAAKNLYVNAVILNVNLKYFSSFGTRLWKFLHSDWRKLTKRLFKRQTRESLLTVLGTEDDYVNVHSLVLKLNTYYYCIS